MFNSKDAKPALTLHMHCYINLAHTLQNRTHVNGNSANELEAGFDRFNDLTGNVIVSILI